MNKNIYRKLSREIIYEEKSAIICCLFLLGLLFGINSSFKVQAASGQYSSSLTTEEIKLYAANPIDAVTAKKCASIAETSTNNMWKPYVTWQGNGDAYRHAYWSALMTKKIDRGFAYKAGLAHEGLTPGYNFNNQNDDTKMDISNNYSGRIAGTNNSSKSDSDLAKVIKSMCVEGSLKRIRTYTSVKSRCDDVLYGVMTDYVGYYTNTSNGGLK